MSTLAITARIVHALLLGAWTGGVAFFWLLRNRVLVLVPSLHDADALLRDMLVHMAGYGLLAGPLLLVTLVVGWAPLQVPLRNRAIGVIIASVMTALSGRWIEPRRAELVAGLGRRLEDVDPRSPRYLELVQLEQVELGLLLAHGFVAVLLLAAAIRADRPKRRFGIEV